ncbi:MAG TPA: tetratricopeptide repeat protein, partial [Candidatus Acidoferrum sp.]|nr:tetratricopeptide repeat protein [Candidatus Acidoferrum sp.]
MRRSRETRRRLFPPVSVVAFVVAAAGGLAALRVAAGASRPELAEPGRDPLTLAYLRAFVAGHPDDAAMRLRLGREQLALGQFAGAEQTLAPLLAAGPPEREAMRLSLDISLAGWRAAPAETPGRAGAEARALSTVELLSGPSATVDELTLAATAARELGRPDLAARAAERAAGLDHESCSMWFAHAARDHLAAAEPASAAASRLRAYECGSDGPDARALALEALAAQIGADLGTDALRFAERLVARFPDDREILARAEALALANGDPRRARHFARRLGELGAADEAVFRRLLDLDLAAGDLASALWTAERMVRLAPADPRFRRLVAQVADWVGRPRLGLPHWMWLARRGDAAALAHALQLAHALDDDAALAELLTRQARLQPLAPAELGELASALERLGSTGQAVSLLEDAARRSEGDVAWEQLVAFHERRRDLLAAIAAHSEMTRRRGASLPRSLQLARLEWAAGRPDAALAELRGWSRTAHRGETEYWRLLAELAWQEESDDLAARALRALWLEGTIEVVGAERLVILSHEAGRPADAIRYGQAGWERFREPRLLLLAMDEAAHAGRWDEVARLRSQAARDEGQFAGALPYWLICAQIDQRTGRFADAARDYHRALLLDSGSTAARTGLVWLLIESGDRERLAAALGAWASEARDDPRLWRAYAAGFERLGRMGDAIAFYRREADASPGDEEARARYLAAVGRAAPAGSSQSTVLTADLAVTALGPVMLRRLGATARTGLGDIELDMRAGLISVSDGGRMPALDRDAVDLLAGATVTALGGRTELMGGAGLQRDRAVPRAL